MNMGAVHTQVKLTNEVDEELVKRGLLAPHHLRSCEVDALVDTGATALVLPAKIVEQLGLRIRGQQIARYADEREEMIGVTGGVIVECKGRQTLEEAMVVGDTVLLGQVILEKLDLWVDCKHQKLIPNPAHPDYPVAYIRRMADFEWYAEYLSTGLC